MGHLRSVAKTQVCDWEEKDRAAVTAAPFKGADPDGGADHSRLHAKAKPRSGEAPVSNPCSAPRRWARYSGKGVVPLSEKLPTWKGEMEKS